jgi:hypothetical protein
MEVVSRSHPRPLPDVFWGIGGVQGMPGNFILLSKRYPHFLVMSKCIPLFIILNYNEVYYDNRQQIIVIICTISNILNFLLFYDTVARGS